MGAAAGALAAVLVVALPGFIPLHLASLTGPPLLAITLLTVGVMMHAPRFSLAYGTLGAVGGLFVAPEGIGLPLGTAAWAVMQRPRGRWQRVALALLPVLVVLELAHLLGGAWPHGMSYGWHGGLDRALRAAGRIIGDQMSPGIGNPALRFFVIADLALVIVAVVVMGWRRIGQPAEPTVSVRRIYPVAGLVVFGLAAGLAGRTLLVEGAPVPALTAVMPLVTLTTLLLAISVAGLWPGWPRWGKVLAAVLVIGWLQAAIRS